MGVLIASVPNHCLLVTINMAVDSSLDCFASVFANRVCCFQSLDAIFPRNAFSFYLEITTSVVVPCGGPKNAQRTSM